MSEQDTAEQTNSTTEAATETVETHDEATALGAATVEDRVEETAETDDTAEPEKKPEVPETYDLKLTVKAEDGTESEAPLDTALVEVATPVLKEAGLTNDQANRLISLVPQIQERMIQQQNDAFAETRAEWAKAAQSDEEIGGKNWKASISLAAKALDHFGAPSQKNEAGEETNAFRKLLNETGLGEHPDMIRMFRKIGEAVAEDGTFPRSEGTRAVKKSPEENLYPDDVPRK